MKWVRRGDGQWRRNFGGELYRGQVQRVTSVGVVILQPAQAAGPGLIKRRRR